MSSLLRLIRGLEFQTGDVFDIRRLPRAIERDEKRKPDGHFSRRDRDDEKHEDLRVVIRQPG